MKLNLAKMAGAALEGLQIFNMDGPTCPNLKR